MCCLREARDRETVGYAALATGSLGSLPNGIVQHLAQKIFRPMIRVGLGS